MRELFENIATNNFERDAWVIALCEIMKEDSLYNDYSWRFVLMYLLKFHSQMNHDNDVRKKLIEYMVVFSKLATHEVLAKMLGVTLNHEESIDTSTKVDFLVECIEILFSKDMHNEIFFLVAQEVILGMTDYRLDKADLLAEFMKRKLTDSFNTALLYKDQDEYKKIINTGVKSGLEAFKQFTRLHAEKNISVLREYIELIFQRFCDDLKDDTNGAAVLRAVIFLGYTCESYLTGNMRSPDVQKLFQEKYMPLIVDLECNQDQVRESYQNQGDLNKFDMWINKIKACREAFDRVVINENLD